jgi:membrane-associated phospholipid phosphatase
VLPQTVADEGCLLWYSPCMDWSYLLRNARLLIPYQWSTTLAAKGARSDPMGRRSPPVAWRTWFPYLRSPGRESLGPLGLVLGLGFGAAALKLWSFAELAEEVASGDTQATDNLVLAWVDQTRSPTLDWVARAVSLGGSEWVLVLAAGLLVVLGWQRCWSAAVSLLLVVGGAHALNEALKEGFQRARPESVQVLTMTNGYSFPSGHTMVAAAFYVFLAYLLWRLLRGWRRWVSLGGLLSLVVVIGWSRLYLGAHFLTDVVGGFLAGAVWAEAVILAGYVLAWPGRSLREAE